MKNLYITIVLIFSFVAGIAQQKVDVYSLKEALTILENEKNVQVFYNIEDIDSVQIGKGEWSGSLEAILQQMIGGQALHYLIVRDKQVFITKQKVDTFSYKSTLVHTITNNEAETKEIEKPYLLGRSSKRIETLVIGDVKGTYLNKKVNVQVNLMNEESAEPLIAASMFILETKKGAVSDMDGNLSISLEAGRRYTAEFSCLGLASKTYYILPYSDGEVRVQLMPDVFAIQEITIKADQQNRLRGVNAGMEKLSMKKLRDLPSFMGEKDVIKITTFLPGVQTAGEGTSGLYVRGGNADQNIFYLNGIPIYNASHVYGFFSSFNTAMIKDFSLYKGHIPSEYGGRLSSIFELNARDGEMEKLSVRGGFSPIALDVVVEGPIKKEKVTFLFSARSSYSDWIMNQIDDPVLRSSKAGFSDFAGLLNFKLNDQGRLKLFLYYSKDDFVLSGNSIYGYQNKGASLQYKHVFSKSMALEATFATSAYHFQKEEVAELSTAYKQGFLVEHSEAKVLMKYTLNPKHHIQYGINSILYHVDRGIVTPLGSESIRTSVDLGKDKGLESALFINDTFKPYEWLTFYGGLRFSNYRYLGPNDVLTYPAGVPKSVDFAGDKISYSSNKTIQSYNSPELRFSLNLRPASLTSIKLALNTNSQNLFMLSNTLSISPGDQWKMADSHIKPATSLQYSLGVLQEVPQLGVSFSVELYKKETKNILEYKDGIDFLSSPYIETLILQGDQSAYGAEFLFKKNKGTITGWLTYTYSRSFTQVKGSNSWDKINNGLAYPSNYDVPHAVNAIVNMKMNRRLSFSTNMVYKTGKPITYPEGIYFVEGRQVVDYSLRNAYKIPDYFRIDASMNVEGSLKKNKFLHSSWMFSVYNLTGRHNANNLFFKMEDGVVNAYKYSVIGVPIFTVKWVCKLGSYEVE